MTIEKVEAAFTKALALTQEASRSLPVECISTSLLETVFAYLVESEKDTEHPAQIKEAA